MLSEGAERKRRKNNVVERAIAKCDGSPQELARRLSRLSGEEISRQRVNGWRMRGIFPRSVMVYVEELAGISLEELATAERRPLDPSGIVQRAIRLLGEGATAATLAAKLSQVSGERYTRQMVNGWQAVEQFPTHVAPWVHLVTKIPIRELVVPKPNSRKK